MQGLYWTLPRDRVEELEDEEESEEEEGEHMTSAAALVEGSVHGGRPDSGGGEQGQPLVSCSRVFEDLSSGLTTGSRAGALLGCLSAAVCAQSPHCDAEQYSASSCRGILWHVFSEALDLLGGVRDMAMVRLTNASHPFGCAMCSNGCQQCSALQPSGASCAGSSWVSAT